MSDWSAILSPSEITINRDGRQRRELTEIPELMESIRARGQIQPIVVTRDHVLVAGERRLTALTRLDFPVKVVYSDEVDPAELYALELEENIKRVNLPWKDHCKAVLEYHRLARERDAKWSSEATAKALGLSASVVQDNLVVARALAEGHRMVLEAPKFSVARGLVTRMNERKAAAEASELTALLAPPKPRPPAQEGIASDAPLPMENDTEQFRTGTGCVLTTNFHDWAETYDGPKFNLIQCDFPYGVGMHRSEQGSGDAHGTYEDTPDVYWSLVDTLLSHIDQFTEESAHLVFWFSMDYYGETLGRLGTRFRVNPFPLVWHKSDGAGIIPDANRGPRRTYETAFLASRGDRKIVRPVTNSVAAPISRGRHMSEKPQEVLRHFFRMLVDEHTTLLDPTCGSGSALRAAQALGARRFLGLERNPEFANLADEALAKQMEGVEDGE